MVTGPVQKETITPLEPHFVGQTELLARRYGLPDSAAVMVLTDPKLTVALCTHHCALREALQQLTAERIVHVAQQVGPFLQLRGTARPRLALAGVNPHAGEGGMFGDEEKRILQPALNELRRAGVDITGPHSPDTVFHRAINGAFDAVICAYHDQGLIPFKLVAFHTGVNITLGLPLIRTSPDHGTALDIAGKGVADHRSMLAAVQLACNLVASAIATSDPLSRASRRSFRTARA
jgi:4-hydroxythreonine-4-phosphate dehydrogenase